MDEEESFTLSRLESAVVFFNSGVFIGLFYAIICFHSQRPRSYVKTLVDGVSKATFTGFKVYDDAVEDYFEAKAAGLVRVVREPGDELLYGPLSKAVM